MKKVLRQGDMEVIQISKKEIDGLKAVEKTGSLTIGIGETSGHSHLIRPIGKTVIVEYAAETETLTKEDLFVDREEIFFEVRGGNAVILHEEHGPQIYTPGFYKRYNQLAYNPFEKRLEKVRD